MNTIRLKAISTALVNYALGLHRAALGWHLNAVEAKANKAGDRYDDQVEAVRVMQEHAYRLNDEWAERCAEADAVELAIVAELQSLPFRIGRVPPPAGTGVQIIDKRK